MSGYFGNGATLKFGTTQTVSEITQIGSPNYEADDIETTTHNNSDYYRTFVKGLIDAGEIDVSGYAGSGDITYLESLMSTRTIQSVTVTLPTGPSVSKFEVNGYVKSYSISAPFDDIIDYELKIKITGKPTFSKV